MKKHILWCLLLLMACSGDDPLEPTVYDVPKAVEKYVQSFVEEGQKRGINIELENLIVEIRTTGTTSGDECGSCTRAGTNGQRKITLVESGLCWKSTIEQNREALVFHELGHCLLQRNHRDDLLTGGAPASLMNSRAVGFYEACAYPIGNEDECDKRYRRTYYLDELFNAKTPAPGWGK
ncbi:hypothetical protein [Telluribacter sp.]|jgi:hypothetical protein|uniref:hypothetical protein n=1 Tax=Telluribacter sp. TaxID=1978767 RepID=UPI002E13204E|nr:hypothetical protein [Telluribacter sp.]